MKVFLIYGEEKAGKTTTCRKILDWLNANGWSQICYERIEDPADNWFNDFKVKGLYNDKTIAIYSPGDDHAHVRNAIAFANETPICDILIATVRKGIHYHKVTDPVEASSSHSVMWIILQSSNIISEKERMENEIADQIIQTL